MLKVKLLCQIAKTMADVVFWMKLELRFLRRLLMGGFGSEGGISDRSAVLDISSVWVILYKPLVPDEGATPDAQQTL